MTRMATAALLREALMKAKRYMERKERAKEENKQPELDVKMESLVRVSERSCRSRPMPTGRMI